MSVKVKDNNLDFALRRLKTEVARNGTLSKDRERADGYKKPGVRSREEKKINTINSRKNNKNYKKNNSFKGYKGNNRSNSESKVNN